MKIRKPFIILDALNGIVSFIIVFIAIAALHIKYGPEKIKAEKEMLMSTNDISNWEIGVLDFSEKVIPYLYFIIPSFFLLGLFLIWNELGREYVLDDEKITIKYYFYSFLSLPKKKKILLDEIKGLVAGNDSVIIELNKGTETLNGLSKPKEVTEEIRKRVALKSSRAL